MPDVGVHEPALVDLEVRAQLRGHAPGVAQLQVRALQRAFGLGVEEVRVVDADADVRLDHAVGQDVPLQAERGRQLLAGADLAQAAAADVVPA
ncbi:hypothetical protein G6F65_022946 [Rhizopus arrhizus]|nr:hypothetical protein G6F65_022946 [Rhizopus arrhizus]